jgi:antitoxin component YwqK of YwqJK toxin-antitoxin module
VTFKDGIEDGKYTWWYENGQKSCEGNYKNGKEDGKWTDWYDNGQKSREVRFKDDDLVLIIGRWNEDGSVRND